MNRGSPDEDPNRLVVRKIRWDGHFRRVVEDEGELLTTFKDQQEGRKQSVFADRMRLLMKQDLQGQEGDYPR